MPKINLRDIRNDRRHDTLRDFDLAGRAYHIVYDCGEEELYQFSTGEDVIRVSDDQKMLWLTYGCRKMDDTLRMIVYDIPGLPWYECVTLIVDESNGLVTRIVTTFGREKGRPTLANNQFTFGALQRDGMPLPEKRHYFSTDLSGKKIAWTYPGGFINVHIYMDHLCRAQALQRPAGDKSPLIDDPIYEEPAQYIRIRDNMYVMLVTEVNMNRRNPKVSGNLLILINTDTVKDIGRNFIHFGDNQHTWGFFHADGRWYDGVTETELAPSPNYV